MTIAKGTMRDALQMIGQIAHRRMDATMVIRFEDGELKSWEATGEEYVRQERKLTLDRLPRRRKKKAASRRKKRTTKK